MSKIHILQVKHGDAFVIECCQGKNKGVVVVDGGPSGCGYVLTEKLRELGRPDLMVLTHYDDDHIGGIMQLINECLDDDTIPAKEMWANCAGYVPFNTQTQTSAADGAMLSKTLNEMEAKGLIWKDNICEGYKRDLEYATIEVVSPTEAVMGMAIKKLKEEGEKIFPTKATTRTDGDLETEMTKLSDGHKPKEANLEKDDELANAASIAFILRCEGLSILMLGDSYPQNVEAYLRGEGYSESKPLEVDYVKVSHHGSRNNTSNSLLDIIKCKNYIISTNGGLGVSNHPDRTAIAHILCHPTRDRNEKVHLYFNHGIDLIEENGAPFLREGENDAYNFEIHPNVIGL